MAKPVLHDVTIVGGGLTGLMMTAVLAYTGARITLIDRAPANASMPDERTTTINVAGVRMLEALGVWQRMDQLPSPVMRIAVAEGAAPTGLAARRRGNADLDWTSDDGPMAHVVNNASLLRALAATVAEMAREFDITIYQATTVTDFTARGAGKTQTGQPRTNLTLRSAKGDEQLISTDLVVACDGARSPLAKAAGLSRSEEAQIQTAICTTLVTERHHQDAAYQRFLASGPFALMPGPGHEMSLVWTLPNAEADRLLGVDQTEFEAACISAFGASLGYLHLAGARLAWKLQPGIRRRITSQGLVLAGDAAHTIHPLAGQGYNLALTDAAVLADLLCANFGRGLPASHASLRADYERDRRNEIMAMSLATSGLNRLFYKTPSVLRRMAGVGFSVLNRLPVKSQLSDIARGGQLADARLLRGKLPG